MTKKSLSKTKTFKYLMASMSSHGREVSQLLNSLHIEDVYLGEKEFIYSGLLYVLVNGKKTEEFNHKLEILRTYNFITSDYEVSDELELHMILIEIPDRHIKAYDNFLTGKYSQMYDPEFVRAIFKRFPKRKMILLKDPKYKSQLEKELGLRDGFIARNAELLDPINYEKEIYKYQEVVT